jgi:uncharacterized phage-associated protein
MKLPIKSSLKTSTVSVLDVVDYILSKHNPISPMKLHKLLYYCQAWSLVWDGKPLFSEKIEAWANGPVVRDLYAHHRLQYEISEMPGGDKKNLTGEQRTTIDSVLKFYGDKSPQWLSDLTHSEAPWKIARKGLVDGERGNREILLSVMEEYYSSLSKN